MKDLDNLEELLASARMMDLIARVLVEQMKGRSSGFRLGVAIAMIDIILDETPDSRDELLQNVIKTLNANNKNELVELDWPPVKDALGVPENER